MEFKIEETRIYAEDEFGKVIAEILFPKTGDNEYTIEHTFVDESLRGQGVASQLVQMAVDQIHLSGGQVKATCSYAIKWLEKNAK